MNVGQLRAVLGSVARMYEEAGDNAKSSALMAFANLLEGHDGKTVSSLVSQLEQARNPAARTTAPRRKRKMIERDDSR